ncbi:MAG: SDR family oxidoreductase [Crenarchaeota archaeon]|nr:SDR family oxidoreductase [Thermoproteota archaeon]
MRVLVTASSRGIGFGIAKVLVREGAKVVISSRNRERLYRALHELNSIGSGEAYAVQADLTRREDIERLVKETVDRLGGLDALVYVTGPPRPGRFQDLELDDWEYGVRLLIMSAVWLTYYSLPYIVESANPSITYVTSVAVREPIETIALSNTLRISVHGLVKTLARELGRKNVRVNAVLPGYIYTDRIKEIASDKASRTGKSIDEVINDMVKEVPLGRIGKPEEVGYLVAFLISRYASYINGASIPIDGGLLRSVF